MIGWVKGKRRRQGGWGKGTFVGCLRKPTKEILWRETEDEGGEEGGEEEEGGERGGGESGEVVLDNKRGCRRGISKADTSEGVIIIITDYCRGLVVGVYTYSRY